MKAVDRIKKAHVAIMRHKKWCAYSGVLACGEVEVSLDIPSACTDGWNVQYGEAFVDALNDEELRYLVLHENTHKSYRHTTVWKGLAKENPRLANIAMDLFVNLSLDDTDAGEGFIKMPEKGVKGDPKYRGWSVKQIYDALKQEQEGGAGQGEGEGEGGEGSESGDGFDEHDFEGAEGMSAAEQEARGNEIERAIRQGEALRKKRSANGAGDADGVFGDLLKAKVDWREVLREWITALTNGKDESTWRKPSRRYLADDMYMPSMQGVSVGEIVIGFDTSGSCFGTDTMTHFVSEITSLIEMVCPEKVHVIYWDTRIAGHQTFEEGQFAVQQMKVRGGGGTDGSILFEYLREKNMSPVAVVQFSDGEVGDWGRTDWPTLWALTGNMRAPYGTTINLD